MIGDHRLQVHLVLQVSANSAEVKWLPLSLTTVFGTPYLGTQTESKALTALAVVLSGVGTISIQPVARSTRERTYEFPLADLVRGPAKSMCTVSNLRGSIPHPTNRPFP